MKIDTGALKLPPTRVLFMHSSRIAARWGTNRTQLRAMLNSSQAEVQRLGETLAAKRPPAVADRITEIERYRQYLCGRSAAIRHGVPQNQMVEMATRGSKSPRWAALILDLVTALRPARVLEMGTAIGVSGAYIAAGLEANGCGELVTVESSRRRHDLARATFLDLGLDPYVTAVHGPFDSTLESLAADGVPIDLVFKDGAHTRSATTGWFDTLAPALADRSAFLFDDIRRDDGMHDAWEDVRRRPRVAASVDFFGMGLLVLAPADHPQPEVFRFGIR